MIFIIRNSKQLISAGVLLAILLAAGMGINVVPRTANAAEYNAEETFEETQQEQRGSSFIMENSPYGPYEMMPQAQRNAYVQAQQMRQERQQMRQNRLPFTEPRDFEAEAAAEAARIMAENQARVVARKSQIEEEMNKIWHNPLTVDTYVSSPFGMRRHPVYRTWRMHKGVDLDSDSRDVIRASRGGTVIAAGWNDSYGYYVKIDHGDGFVTEYFHMRKYYVKKGQEVRYCEPIGEVGSTGVSTGSHLHFGMLYQGEYVDPEDYIDFEA